MKSYVALGTVFLTGLFLAFMIGFDYHIPFQPTVSTDDEQDDLDRQIVIKFSHVVAENTPKGVAARKFASLVEEKTNDRVKVEVYPNGMLYNDQEELTALKHNDVQMIAPAFSKLTKTMPEWHVFDLPFAFPNHEAVETAFNGEIGELLLQTLTKEDLHGLAFWSNGFKQLTTNDHPVVTPDDFDGMRFRIMPSDVLKEQFLAVDAKPYEIPFNDVYRNLQIDYLDGQENTISNIYSKKFYEVQDYITISDHGYLGYVVMTNDTFWTSLSPALQQVIGEAMAEATTWMQQEAIAINQKQLHWMVNHSNLQLHMLTDEEKEAWQKDMLPVYDKFAPVIGDELMEEVRRIQQKY